VESLPSDTVLVWNYTYIYLFAFGPVSLGVSKESILKKKVLCLEHKHLACSSSEWRFMLVANSWLNLSYWRHCFRGLVVRISTRTKSFPV
jgi:hypothetical protein